MLQANTLHKLKSLEIGPLDNKATYYLLHVVLSTNFLKTKITHTFSLKCRSGLKIDKYIGLCDISHENINDENFTFIWYLLFLIWSEKSNSTWSDSAM